MEIKVYQTETDSYKKIRVIGKYMYIGEDYGISLIKGKCYYRVEPNNEFRIVDETDEDYLYPSIYFEEIEIYD